MFFSSWKKFLLIVLLFNFSSNLVAAPCYRVLTTEAAETLSKGLKSKGKTSDEVDQLLNKFDSALNESTIRVETYQNSLGNLFIVVVDNHSDQALFQQDGFWPKASSLNETEAHNLIAENEFRRVELARSEKKVALFSGLARLMSLSGLGAGLFYSFSFAREIAPYHATWEWNDLVPAAVGIAFFGGIESILWLARSFIIDEPKNDLESLETKGLRSVEADIHKLVNEIARSSKYSVGVYFVPEDLTEPLQITLARYGFQKLAGGDSRD